VPPPTTALGSLLSYVTDRNRKDFQPMNANYGLFPPIADSLRGREKRAELGRRAAVDLERWIVDEAVDAASLASERRHSL
jgi:methylenetetrahydrofolate--tRNA-(uracil-5-)-methyltransferase